MTMRITHGKIYGFAAIFLCGNFAWNRYVNRGVKARVEGIQEEKLRQAEELRRASEVQAAAKLAKKA